MTMRVASRRAGDVVEVSLPDFAWARAHLATLRHSTLQWSGGAFSPLASLTQLGVRDRLSLVAQFAAHQSFLQFAGISDGDVDPAEWAVEQKRGSDCRLIRVAARNVAPPPAAAPHLTRAQQFAELVGAPKLDVLRQSWARAESVFAECWSRLRADAASDLRWTRASAAGTILSPGSEAIERGRRYVARDESIIESMRAMAAFDKTLRVITIRGGSIVRYGALEELRPITGDDFDVARIAARAEHFIFIVAAPEALDAGSKRVVQLLPTIDGTTMITIGDDATLPAARSFIVATRVAHARAIEEKPELAARALENLDAFLDRGEIPAAEVTVGQPYIAALALLGNEIPRATASRFLREFEVDLDDVIIDGVTAVDDTYFRILKPVGAPLSREAVSRVAASVAEESGDLVRAGLLLTDSGDAKRGMELLERATWRDSESAIAAPRPLPARTA